MLPSILQDGSTTCGLDKSGYSESLGCLWTWVQRSRTLRALVIVAKPSFRKTLGVVELPQSHKPRKRDAGSGCKTAGCTCSVFQPAAQELASAICLAAVSGSFEACLLVRHDLYGACYCIS